MQNLTMHKTLEDAIEQARQDLDGETVIICRFPTREDLCGGRSDMDNCPSCLRIDATEKRTSRQIAQMVQGGN